MLTLGTRTFIGLILMSCYAQAQFVVPGDEPYWTRTRGGVQYIYSAAGERYMGELAEYMDYFQKKYQQSFHWSLSEAIKLALASPRNQIANGFATVIPMLQTVLYTSGFEILDQLAQSSFLVALASHETAHLYQLSPETPFSAQLTQFFGHPPVIVTPIIPIFPYPNLFLPSFMLEGNAVVNESAVHRGGRLWSGLVRAEVLAEYEADRINPNWLINNRLEFPFSRRYHVGGYFLGYLAETEGLDRVNQFHLTHAHREFWPFGLNKSFREHYKKSYSRLIHEFRRWLKPLAAEHHRAQGQRLGRVVNFPYFNHSAEAIFFLGNPTGRGPNHFFSVHKPTGELSQRTSDLPLGKSFSVGGRDYAVSSEAIHPSLVSYALFGTGLYPLPETLGEITQDIRAGHWLSVDAAQSYAHGSLMKDHQFLDTTHSSALLDEQGRAYYFRQVGSTRVLYRDREPLFKFAGYFGILCEIEKSGAVDFIAATPSGATLFQWHEGSFVRVFDSDNVVNARHLINDEYIVAAVTSEGYEIQRLKAQAKPSEPAVYPWQFKMEDVPFFPEGELKDASPTESYGPVHDLHYAFTSLTFAAGHNAAAIFFTDPLQWNLLQAAVDNSVRGDLAVGLAYENHRHRLGWSTSGEYDRTRVEDRPLLSPKLVYRQRYRSFVNVLLDYQLLKQGRWTATAAAGPTWTLNTEREEDKRRYGVETDWDLIYFRSDFGLDFDPYRYMKLRYMHRTESDERIRRKVDSVNGAQIHVSGDIFRQTFLSLSGSWAVAEDNSIKVDYLNWRRPMPFVTTSLYGDGDAAEEREWNVGLKQAVDLNWYGTRFPVGLRRIAPYTNFVDVFTKEKDQDRLPGWRQQVQYGLELELLLFHLLPARALVAFDTVNLDDHFHFGPTFTLNIGREF